MTRFRFALGYWVFALAFFTPTAAHAYIDPATTTYIIQIITALVVTLGVSLSVFLYRFRMISAKLRYGLYGLLYKLRGKQGGARASEHGSSVPTNTSGAVTAQASLPTAGSHTNASTPVSYTCPLYVLPAAPLPPKSEELAAFGAVNLQKLTKTVTAPMALGKRPYFGRLRAALPISLALPFTFILFSFLESMAQNAGTLPFALETLLPVFLGAFLICFAALLFTLPLFRSSLYETILALALALLLGGYIQGTFLNLGLPELTGDQIIWSDYTGKMLLSACVWVGIFAFILLLRRFSPSLSRGFSLFAPILILVMQVVALVSVLGSLFSNTEWGDGRFWQQSGETLTIEGLNEPAAGKNAIVFILDRFDMEYEKDIAAADPAFFDRLDGFTLFDDNIAPAASTFPGVTNLLTGHRFSYDQSHTAYFNEAWARAELLHELKARGVDIRLYAERGDIFDHREQLEGLAGNLATDTVAVNERIAFVKFMKLAAFRYAPMPTKFLFWLTSAEFNDALEPTETTTPYVVDDFKFSAALSGGGLKPRTEDTAFLFYHLLGPHGPLHMDENLNWVAWSTPAKQGMGAMKIVYDYLDRLKALGLYDDALIIITGDHGIFEEKQLDTPRLTALFVKPSGSFGTPLAVNHAPVSTEQFAATVLQGLFDETGSFGETYFDISEGADALRLNDNGDWRYEIRGDGRDFKNWRFLGVLPDLK